MTAFIKSAVLHRDKVPNFDTYPFSIPALRNFKHIDFHPKVTFLLGENGAGKSTLIEAIAVASGFNAEGGSKNFNFSTKATHSELHDYLWIERNPLNRPTDGYFLRAESFYNVASEIDKLGGLRRAYGGKSLHEQSHGESFLSLMNYRFLGGGLYIMDEPEAALSPVRQLAMLRLIDHYAQHENSQFVIATHSPIVAAYPDATILEVTEDGVEPIAYEDYSAFGLLKDFLGNREYFVEKVMRNDV